MDFGHTSICQAKKKKLEACPWLAVENRNENRIVEDTYTSSERHGQQCSKIVKSPFICLKFIVLFLYGHFLVKESIKIEVSRRTTKRLFLVREDQNVKSGIYRV